MSVRVLGAETPGPSTPALSELESVEPEEPSEAPPPSIDEAETEELAVKPRREEEPAPAPPAITPPVPTPPVPESEAEEPSPLTRKADRAAARGTLPHETIAPVDAAVEPRRDSASEASPAPAVAAVEEPPVSLSGNRPPIYPPEAYRRRQTGEVIIDVLVRADGSVGGISVARSSGHAALDRAALKAVRRWQFQPARSAGKPVASRITLPVRFVIEK